MRNKKLQGQVTAGRWTLPIVVFICTLCWVLTSFLLPDLTASTVEDSTLSLWQSARDLLLPALSVCGRPCRQPYTFCWSLSARKCTCYMQETLQPLLSCSPFISCSKVISSRRQQAIYSILSFSSEREACFSPNSPSFRYSGYSKLTVFRHSSPVVSAVRS